MSVVAQSLKRPWLALGLALIALLVVAAAAIMANLPGKRIVSDGGASPTGRGSIAAPEFEQPRWNIDAFPAGAMAEVSNADLASIAKQRPKLAAIVTSVYDALFLEPPSIRDAVKKTFSAGAAGAMQRTDAGLPRDATDVRIKRRFAKIGVQPDGARHAAASVKIIATAQVGGRTVDIKHRSILWMERGSHGWRVIGFDVRQGPFKANAAGPAKKHDGKGRGRPEAKGKKRS